MEQDLNARELVTISRTITAFKYIVHTRSSKGVLCLLPPPTRDKRNNICKSRRTITFLVKKSILKFRITGTRFGKSEGLHVQRNDHILYAQN